MSVKTIVLAIILSICIGVAIVFLTSFKPSSTIKSASPVSRNPSVATPTTNPQPTLPPLTTESNLLEEVQKLTPEDFSKDFNLLKNELSNL